jgi:hypothetical protein
LHLGILLLTVWLVFPASVKGASRVRTPAVFKVLAALVLSLSDALLAVVVWLPAYELQSIGGPWSYLPKQTAMVVGVFVLAVWIGLRSLMGLYPGYGLSSEERLRRHTYSVVGTLAAVFIAILLSLRVIASKPVPFEVYESFPRLLLALGFVGLLLLPPLVQGFARREMRRLGIWGGPVDDGPR